MEGESINHADNSVYRSQPEALIIHTYTQNQGGSLRAMLATKHPSSPKGSPHSSHWLMHTHAYIHTHVHVSWEMIYFRPVMQQVKEQGAGEERLYRWNGEKTNLITFLPP